MKETFIILGGTYMVGLIIFHALFWRLFRWPTALKSLNYVDKATMQVLNLSITFIFVIFAFISFFHTKELVTTNLGQSLIASISILWLFRAGQQVFFYKLRHKASIALTFYFLVGAALYGIPCII